MHCLSKDRLKILSVKTLCLNHFVRQSYVNNLRFVFLLLFAASSFFASLNSEASNHRWKKVTPNTDNDWRSVSISADGTKIIACAYDDAIYTSEDFLSSIKSRYYAAGWYEYNQFISSSVSADGSKVVACSMYYVYISLDGGVTWSIKDPGGNFFNAVDISSDGSSLIACTHGGGIYISSDNGENWQRHNPTGNADLAFTWYDASISADGSRIIASGQYYASNYVSISTDGGDTWSTVEPAGTGINKVWLSTAISPDGQKMAVAAQDDFLYMSENGGSSWSKRQPAGTGVTKTWSAIALSSDASKIIACSDIACISGDHGATWSNTGISAANGRVSMTPDGSKIVLSGGSYLHTSDDGGSNWIRRESKNSGSSKNWIKPVTSSDGGKVFIAASGNFLYNSSDRGYTWTRNEPLGPNVAANWKSIAASSNGQTVISAASNNYLYISKNSCSTWEKKEPAGTGITKQWTSVACSSNGMNIATCAYSDYIYVSDDAADTWKKCEPAGTGVSKSWRSIAMSSDDSTIVCINAFYNSSDNDPVYISSDHGDTWSKTNPAGSTTGIGYMSVSVSGNGQVIAVSSNIGMYVSENSGLTWTQPAKPSGSFIDISVSSDGARIVSSAPTYVYATSDSWSSYETYHDYIGGRERYIDYVTIAPDASGIIASDEGGFVYIADRNYEVTMASCDLSYGTVDPVPGLHSFYFGEYFTVSATPTIGHLFQNWSTTANASIDNPNSSSAKVVSLTGDATVTANFIRNTYDLDFQTDGTPGASLTGMTPQGVLYGDSSTPILANPPEHWHFVNWYRAGYGDYSTENPLTINNVSYGLTLIAIFSIDTNTITASAGPNGSISPNGAVPVNYGADCSFTFAPVLGYHVSDVLVDGESVAADANYAFNNVIAPHTISCTFAINQYALSYNVAPSGNGSISGSALQSLLHGSDGTEVTAVPESGYHFASWSDGSTSNPRTDTNVSSNITVSAIFSVDINWRKKAVTGTGSPSWKSIAMSPDGSKLAAASAYIYTSSDGGVTWLKREPAGAGVTKSWYCVSISSDGNKIAAVALSDYVYTSNDGGISWTLRDPAGGGVAKLWFSVSSSDNGSKIAVVAYNDYVYTSSDAGASWTKREPAGAGLTKNWRSICMNDDGSKIAAGAASSGMYVSSDSGATWTNRNIAASIYPGDSIAMSNDASTIAVTARDMIAGTYGIYTTSNMGVTWTKHEPAGVGVAKLWNAVSISNDGAVITAVAGNDYVYLSTTAGATWSKYEPAGVGIAKDWHAVALTGTGGKLAAGAWLDGYNIYFGLTHASGAHVVDFTASPGGSLEGAVNQDVELGCNLSPVTALPDTGYHFVNWSGDYTGNANPLNIANIQGDMTITANFEINSYTLTYLPGANGAVSGTNPQTINYGADGIAVTAVPNEGYHFCDWSDGVLAASRTETNVIASKTVTANFAIDTYTLSYNAGANGSITGTTPQAVELGADGSQVTATPAPGYHFVSWDDGVMTAARTDTGVKGDKTASASFAINIYTVTFVEGVHGTITGTKVQNIEYAGDCVLVTAVPAANYRFLNWTGDYSETANPLAIINVSADMTITANFVWDASSESDFIFDAGTGTITGYVGAGGTVVVPLTIGGVGVTSIGKDAFLNCHGLINLIIPSSVTSIGTGAFNGCSSLETVSIPDSVTSIGDYAFSACSLLVSITIPSGVTSIGQSTFNGCSKLASITIPDGVLSVGDWAFYGTATDIVTIPQNVATIGIAAFGGCSTTAFSVDPANQDFSSVDGIVFNKDKTCIVQYPGGKTGTYVIPSGVTTIGSWAFTGSSSLIGITIPSGVVSIEDGAFSGCKSLNRITVPSSVAMIGDSAFAACTSLDSAYFYGNAPAAFGSDVFDSTASTFAIYCNPSRSGFTSPLWNGYSCHTFQPTVSLANGSARNGISGLADSVRIYSIYVPSGQTLLEIRTTGITGDCDIDVIDPMGLNVKRSMGAGCKEFVQIANPASGDWLIYLYGITDYAGVSVTAKFSRQTAVPGVPAGVKASDGLFSDRILVTWPPVAGATGYVVGRKNSLADTIFSEEFETADTIFEDNSAAVTGEDPGTLFYYFVKAKNAIGYGSYGTGNSGYIAKVPAAPATPTVSDGTYFDHINIKWTKVADATMYEVWRSDTINSAGAKFLSRTSQIFYDNMADDTNGGTVSKLGRDTTYYYFIKAGNGNGWSDFSKRDSGKVSVKGPAKVIATQGVYSDRIVISWTAVPGATTYDVYRDGTYIPGSNTAGRMYSDTPGDSDPHAYQIKGKSSSPYDSDFSPSATGQALPTGKICSATSMDIGDTSGLQTDLIGGIKYFSVEVPFGTTRLVATIDCNPLGNNDCDLFAKFANYPTKASYSVKGVEAGSTEALTVSNPAAGTWYFLLYGTTAYSGVTLTVKCYSVADVVLTQVPANDLAVPFTAAFIGKVVDETGVKGIPNIVVRVRNPITGLVIALTKTDAKGVFKYSALVNSEGEHTFEFFFIDMPDTAKGTASHTVATRKGCLESNGYFDMSCYLPAKPVAVPLHPDIMGLQNFLDTRNGWDDDAIDDNYATKWIDNTLVKAKDDTQLADKLDEGLYMFFYGVEGAGVGNDTSVTSALSAVPFMVHVASGNKGAVLDNLKTLGIIDDIQYDHIKNKGMIGIVSVATLSSPDDTDDVPENISLAASEQLELLAKIAAGAVGYLEAGKYSDVNTSLISVILDNGRKINVVTAASVK